MIFAEEVFATKVEEPKLLLPPPSFTGMSPDAPLLPYPGMPEELIDQLLHKTPRMLTTLDHMELTLQARGKGLDKKDFFGKSDPYYKILRLRDGCTLEDYYANMTGENNHQKNIFYYYLIT